MKNMGLLTVITLILSTTFLVSASSCGSGHARAADTLRVSTAGICDEIIGYNGPTPVELTVVKGVVIGIRALPNQETPRFFQRVLDSGLLGRLDGMTVEEAKAVGLDAVTGATFSSEALIRNIRAGLSALDPKPAE